MNDTSPARREGEAPPVTLTPQLTPVINYALQQNRLPILAQLTVHNPTDQALTDLTLTVESEPPLLLPFSQPIAQIPPRADYTLQGLPVRADPARLVPLTERVEGSLTLRLAGPGGPLAEYTAEVTALAFDEWHGVGFYPELLCAFVTPNHPEVTRLAARAAEFLGRWSDSPSLDGYQRQNPNRVRLQAAAVYAALQEQNIVYAVPPASFEAVGQRVRMCDAVMSQKLGTCLDLTLFYAAVLEAIGLHPLLVIQPGHIFAGVWLEDLTFPEAVQDDPSLLTKRLAEGIGEIAVVECTSLTAGKAVDFDRACAIAEQELLEPVECILDVSRARLSGIRPLPQRVRQADGWRVETAPRREAEITGAPREREEPLPAAPAQAPAAPAGRVAQWERKLLDLGLRNPLIHLRLTQRVVPILADSLARLEDALADGEEYAIGPRPAEWDQPEAFRRDPEQFADLGPYRELIHSEFENRRLRCALSETELAKALTGLYRAARASLEENGANTLYLALGLLRWFESRASERPRYAPLLLLPVDILRKSAGRGYVIRLREEEPQLNITLLEMLRQDFGIAIGGLDPLPQDEHGVALRTVYATIRRAVMDQPRWDVVETAFLGIFSFSQFVMWNDIRNRVGDLQRSKIVRSLVDGRLHWTPPPMDPAAPVDEGAALLPIPADASQLYAIEQAATGQSFVLHGPPGTGKSQTITALIANALAQDKTVLFVAEKMAALSVVESRLDKIGIGPFCLELHSNKSKKRDVLEQLRAAAEVAHGRPRQSWKEQAEEAARLRAALDAYARALHRERPCGASLFALVGRYEDCKTAPSAFQLPADFAARATRESLEAQERLLGQLTAVCREVGDPAAHPLRLVGRAEYSPARPGELAAALGRFLPAAEALSAAGGELAAALELPPPATRADWQQLVRLADLLQSWRALPAAWTRTPDPEPLWAELEQFAAHTEAWQQARALLDARWQESFLEQDAAALKAAWTQAGLQWALPRMLGQNRIRKLLAPHAKVRPARDALAGDLDLLARYQGERREAEARQDRLGAALAGLAPEQTAPAALRALAGQGRALARQLTEQLGPEAPARLAAPPRLPVQAQAVHKAAAEAREAWEALAAAALPREEALARLDWAGLRQQCREMADHVEALKDWCVWNQTCAQAEQAGMGPLVEALRTGLPPEQARPAWQRATTLALILDTVAQDPALSRFSGSVFNEAIRQFRELDARLTELARTEIYCRLAAQVPDFTQEAANSSEVGILQRAIRSGGRGISIRRLFEQIPTLLPRLCPCMLMSPLSVAQYLDPDRPPFDLVVFDEASQLPTCKAVGVLARGENAVIVGDPNQMPPTSFFTGSGEDEENLEQEDLESILDDCLALNMPQSHLLWHYRSRHESLIAFSNREFYENQLYTFPSADDRQSMVQLVPVEGWFDRGKTRQNRAEAEAIVAELARRAHDPEQAAYSVGVVTFNVQQQNLISDLLDEACRTDEALEAWAFGAAEPLFIKNLENVQGDERDVILFSVGYGPDAQGKVTMNFGPLNRDGGWRRLNVAVSRARRQMVVFSTLQPDQIDLARTSARGVAALKDFLRFAASGNLQENAATTAPAPGGVARDICDALARHGWQTSCGVGHSQYRLDIGVIDPDRPGRYLLGILLDGEAYRDARTTRDRELAQPSVLEGLGWQLHRIWTMDWLDNRKKELNRLLERLQALKDAPPAPPRAPARAKAPARLAGKPDIVTAPARKTPAPPVYRVTKLPARSLDAEAFADPKNAPRLLSALTKVVEREAPIREGLLIRRVTQSFGVARAGSRIQRQLTGMLDAMGLTVTAQDGERFYWAAGQDPAAYPLFRVAGEGEERREVQDLPVQEIANAAAAVLRRQVGLPADDLIRETGRLLGYARLGSAARPALEAGLLWGIDAGRLCQPRPGYYTLPET